VPAPAEGALRHAIVRVCRRLYERGLIAGPDGNVSVRLGDDRLLVTPSGMSKVDVNEDDLVVVSTEGRPVAGTRRPSSELGMHLRIYARRRDVRAVVHAHPPLATALAVAGEDLLLPVLPEIVVQTGGVPLVPYATPGTEALADAIEPFLVHYDAFLMANHGATSLGPDLPSAHQRMESIEHAAQVLLFARLLGRVNALSGEQHQALLALRAAASRRELGPEGSGDPGAAPPRT
jgi:L-fuculose-phosphate aldolase